MIERPFWMCIGDDTASCLPIGDVPKDVRVHIHPYFRGSLPEPVALRIQASLENCDRQMRLLVRESEEKLELAIETIQQLKDDLEAKKEWGTQWRLAYDQQRENVDRLNTRIRNLKAEVARLKTEAAKPKPRTNAPGWAAVAVRNSMADDLL